MKTEQTTIAHAQCDRWALYDVIKHHVITTSVQGYLLCCNYSPSYEEFSILTREVNNSKLKIMESLLIARDKPCLKKAGSSLPLQLFWYNIVVIIWCFMTSYDVIYHLVRIQLSFVHSLKYHVMIFVFYQKQNMWVFNFILGVTMKAVAFES